MSDFHDSDPLAGVDLSAWQVPPPTPGLADRVVAKVRQPAPLVGLHGSTVRRSRRLEWVALAAGLVVAAGATAVVLAGDGRARADEVARGDASNDALAHRIAEINRQLAEIERMRDEMAPPLQRAIGGGSADDPELLKKQIAALKAQLAERERELGELKELEKRVLEMSSEPPDPAPEPRRRKTLALPESLDRATISEGVNRVKVRILECDPRGYSGQVKLKVTVAPSGVVTHVDAVGGILGAPQTLLDCTAKQMRTARFAASQHGGSFGYPFIFDGGPTSTAPASFGTGGTLEIGSRPPAEVWIDGRDSGWTTPAKIPITPGRHRVTLITPDGKTTFAVTVKKGEVTRVIKQLEVEVVDPFAASSCDEVSCVLSNFEGACCAKFRKSEVILDDPFRDVGPADPFKKR